MLVAAVSVGDGFSRFLHILEPTVFHSWFSITCRGPCSSVEGGTKVLFFCSSGRRFFLLLCGRLLLPFLAFNTNVARLDTLVATLFFYLLLRC